MRVGSGEEGGTLEKSDGAGGLQKSAPWRRKVDALLSSQVRGGGAPAPW